MNTPSGSKPKWNLTTVAFSLLLCALVVAGLTACSSNKSVVAAGLPDPDRGFQTGTVAGYDVWIWECYQDKHIVIYRTSAEMTAGMYEREETPCGELTPIELKLADVEPKRERDPSTFW